MSDLVNKIRRKWIKLRLQPIRVFCLHHICAEFDAESMNAGDWMQIEEFKNKIQSMRQNGVEFISLSEAYHHMCNDWFRCHKYAVLTFDDGYASLKEILPWLEVQHIPVTLFINGRYLDGKSYRKNPKERYLTHDELFTLTSPLIEIGSHGWEHIDSSKITEVEFNESIDQNIKLLSSHPCYIPFHAYTWGRHNDASDRILLSKKIVPVLINGVKNYNDKQFIHRELIPHYT